MYSHQKKYTSAPMTDKSTFPEPKKYEPVIQYVLDNDNPNDVSNCIANAKQNVNVYNGYNGGYYHVFVINESHKMRVSALKYVNDLREKTKASSDHFELKIDDSYIGFIPKPEQSHPLISPDDIPRPKQFQQNIKKSILLISNQARCHTISWEIIKNCVIDICNTAIIKLNERGPEDAEDAQTFFLSNMAKLWFSITGELEPSDAFSKILLYFLQSDNPADRKHLARRIASELHNQLANLRPGYSRTNSSIQSGLDLPADWVKKETLKEGTPYIDIWVPEASCFENVHTLSKSTEMLVIRHSEFQNRLIALLETESTAEISIFTTDSTIQSSDYPNMVSAEKLEPGLRIAVPIGPIYFFFTTY